MAKKEKDKPLGVQSLRERIKRGWHNMTAEDVFACLCIKADEAHLRWKEAYNEGWDNQDELSKKYFKLIDATRAVWDLKLQAETIEAGPSKLME